MATDAPRKNHFAFGAVDNDGDGYVVLEPNRYTDRLNRRAIPVPGGLAKAEQHAEDFNRGGTWAFRVEPGQVLVGEDIPELHRAPRVGWKQCVIPFAASYTATQEAVANRHLALTATRGAIPEDYALFTRDDDRRETTTLLLSAAAAADHALFPGTWTDANDVDEHGWSLLYGDAGAYERMAIRPPMY
jgi:hypothetical protein